MIESEVLRKLENYIQNGYIYGFGGGFDSENHQPYVYVQTTCKEQYDEKDASFELLVIENPSGDEVNNSHQLLKDLSKKYNLPIVWNHF